MIIESENILFFFRSNFVDDPYLTQNFHDFNDYEEDTGATYARSRVLCL